MNAGLDSRPYNKTQINEIHAELTSPSAAASLLRNYDLVVDATADGAVTAMLEDAARAAGTCFVTTCIQDEGRIMRVDVVPPLNGAPAHPATPARPRTQPDVYEAGCGDPVSVTPPHAVAEAAAIAVRHIIGILVGTPQSNAGEVRDLA